MHAFAQREGEVVYDKEFIAGINFHTNGGLIGGGLLRYTDRTKSEKSFNQIGLEVSFIKHPKELRYINISTNNTYIAWKRNTMFVIRPQVGKEWVLFRKAEEDGVQIDFMLASGLSLGFLMPYYIEYSYGKVSKMEAYDPNIHTDPNRILGTGSVLMGLGESKVVPGIHLKPAFSFELGHMNGNVTGIEIGAMFEYFSQSMTILETPRNAPQIENKQLFSSVFLTLYYGFRR